MVRLPIPGGDEGRWGDILNQYLRAAHNEDGSLRPIEQSGVLGLTAALSQKYVKPAAGVPLADLTAAVQATLAKADGAVQKTSLACNVKDYGALGNGSADDTVAIRAAIAAAKSSKLGLYFPAGTYIVSGSLDVGGGFPGALHIFGSGWDSTIRLANNANCYIFTLNNTFTQGLVVRDLFLDCAGNAQTAGGGIDADGAVWCRFERLYIKAPWQAGIFIHNDGTGGFGHHNTIFACRFSDGRNSNGGNGYALLLDRSDENYVGGCSIADCGNTGVSENHMVYDKAGLQMFANNSFIGGDTNTTQLKLQGQNNVVVGNVFDGGTKSNQLRLNGSYNLINGNRFYNIGNAAASLAEATTGILLDNVRGNVISNNIFSPIASGSGFADSGVRIAFGAQANDVHGNGFALPGTGIWQQAAINLSGAGSGNALRFNRGYNPVSVTNPAVPASGVDFTHTFAVDCTVYISGGTVTEIAVQGVPTGLTSGVFQVSAGRSIRLVYSVAPQWVWMET